VGRGIFAALEHLLFALIGDADASMAMKACQVGQAPYYVLFLPPNSRAKSHRRSSADCTESSGPGNELGLAPLTSLWNATGTLALEHPARIFGRERTGSVQRREVVYA
jgi:hypothetical protein